ncbi:hypothetical protein [Alteraurantiacibacter buctensis]|uniref:Tetratricopeptide repeat protein n=1 Tax=Alteraurantiacibacter buctensis TaxID=1503981 RepID=A0A844YTB2_9SPHN|nr:hypothetical protein [Alteraurantiacibacter buctensis]MXO71565.1 hypothetical protein [Alteraurantiacibacter buctensis]
MIAACLRPLAVLAPLLALLLAAPANAQSLDELDALATASQQEEAGTALAQQQAAEGRWLEALATLDRVLAVNPRSQGSRLLHALYLCEVDDKQGGLLELARLKPRELAERRRDGEAILANAEARCRAAGTGAAK